MLCGVSQEEANSPGEDRYCIRSSDGVALFGVYDGHGGIAASHYACNELLDDILNNIICNRTKACAENSDGKLSPLQVNKILTASLEKCDREFLALEAAKLDEERKRSGSSDLCSKPGSCVLIALFMDSYMYFANIG